MPASLHPLITPAQLSLPQLPAAACGLRIAHITDLHVTGRRRRYRQMIDAVAGLDLDMALLTGDYMSDPGDEPVAMQVLKELCDVLRPRLGMFGVFGNHDSHHIREQARELPVHWLSNEVTSLEAGQIEIHGFENEKHKWPDTVALLDQMNQLKRDASGASLRIMLSHYPTLLPVASDLGMHLMFSGHTHGGQWRLPFRTALYTSCDLPSGLSAGVLRHRDTLGVVSRGLGETFINLRIICPPQIPLVELNDGDLPGVRSDGMINVHPW